MKQGVKSVVDKTRKPITLKETLGFDKYRFQGNPMETKKEFNEKMQIAPVSTMQEGMVGDQPLEALGFADYKDAEYIPIAKSKPTLEEIMQGVKPPQTILQQKMDLQNNLLTNPASERLGNTSTTSSTASSTLGTAGTALGAVSALKDLSTKGFTPTTALDTVGTGLQLTGFGAVPGTILKGISSLLKGTTRNN